MRWQTQEQYLRMILARQLDIPMLGKIFYAVPQGSSTSLYEEWARNELDIPAELLFTGALAPAQAFEACSGYRNDVVCVFPGAYDIDTELAWSKHNTHLVGMGGPNTFGDWSEPNVVIYSDNVACASVITVTGANCQFLNFTAQNYGNNAACLTAFTLNKYGCRFKNVSFQGVMTAGNDDVVAAASLYIAADGMYPIFEKCVIGQNVWDVREGALSGMLRFTGTTVGPYGGEFRNCRFLSRSDTATVAMVVLPANQSIGGTWLFDNCSFENFALNWVVNLNQVFYDACGTTHSIILHHCNAVGFGEWQNADAGNNYIASDMPIVGLGGGLARNPTGVAGT